MLGNCFFTYGGEYTEEPEWGQCFRIDILRSMFRCSAASSLRSNSFFSSTLFLSCWPAETNRLTEVGSPFPKRSLTRKQIKKNQSESIAVGTAITSRPPLRSVREELPHTAPALSRAQVGSEEPLYAYPASRFVISYSALCPRYGSLPDIPLDWVPFLHPLRRCLWATFVRRLRRYYGPI